MIYLLSNKARLYRLEQEQTQSTQGDKYEQEFYNSITTIWTEMEAMDPEDDIASYEEMREWTTACQFFMEVATGIWKLSGSPPKP